MKKRTLFTLQIHSAVSLITNSSSELFVGMYNSKKVLLDMLKSIYPSYLSEYTEPMSIHELSTDELHEYISYHYMYWSNDIQKEMCTVIPGFSVDEMYDISDRWAFIKSEFVKDNKQKIINAIDPDKKMFFMFSLDENPKWEYQEKISEIMTRYHLG